MFFSTLNRLLAPADDERDMLSKIVAAAQDKITGIAMVTQGRLACLLEGPADEMAPVWARVERSRFLRQPQLLMQDTKAKARLYPQHLMAWHPCASGLEIAAFVSDVRRQSSRNALWLASPQRVAQLLEPDE
jgi:hypothetical protein